MTALPVIGIDVGGTKIASGVVSRDGELVEHTLRPTPQESQAALLKALEEAIAELRERHEVAAVGFGVPSRIDQLAHRVVGTVHAPLAGVDLAGHMEARFGIPVAVDNDGNAAAVAEWKLGAGKGTSDMVMITLGTGIGGGLILGGRPYRGAQGAGAELGHMVIDLDGPPCGAGCDGRGHFETLASGSAATAKARGLGLRDGEALVAAARRGDEAAMQAVATIGRVLGEGLVSIVNVFNPELIVIGGGFSSAGELLLEPAREVVAAEALDPARDFVRIVLAELGPEAGVIGAGLIAFEALDEAA